MSLAVWIVIGSAIVVTTVTTVAPYALIMIVRRADRARRDADAQE